MSLHDKIFALVPAALTALYQKEFDKNDFQLNITKPEFEGDYTVVLFGLLKKLGKKPAELGEELGNYLVKNHHDIFEKYNIIQGFLNLSISDGYWISFLQKNAKNEKYGFGAPTHKRVMVEYASPNTNKPIHLGHLRNIFLGWSVAKILAAQGNEVIKASIVNDRGVHICKSMYAWQLFGAGKTPASENVKGDHFVGDYYVKYDGMQKQQEADLLSKEAEGDFAHYDAVQKEKFDIISNNLQKLDPNKDEEKIKKLQDDLKAIRRDATPAMKAVKNMLLDWENHDPATLELWKKMNGWVYEGFDETFENIGIGFDKTYYESDTYILGKELVFSGLNSGTFTKKEDNSVWIDLTDEGLDEKLVLRKDGTSVYITQDLGLVLEKHKDYSIDESIYVIADEQNYHMKVLQLIAQKLGLPSADGIKHLSYGMVELPSGKMKSREGTVVDADEIVQEMLDVAKTKTEELGKVQDFSTNELKELYKAIGLGALKFYLLRVDPKKKILFNPEESIDFHGFTAPFIQFNYARIQSILRKFHSIEGKFEPSPILRLEKELINEIERYPQIIKQAASELNPSTLCVYLYNLSKTFSSFYTEHSIGSAESEEKKVLRLNLAEITGNILRSGMNLLGITVPERM